MSVVHLRSPKPYAPIYVTTLAILLIRTYAFFNRNNYILAFLICAILGVVAYQLYVDTSQMLCPSSISLCVFRMRSQFFPS